MMSETTTLQKRDEMDQKFCWHMEDLFADDQAWMCAYGKLQTQIDAFSKNQGKLGESPEIMYKIFQEKDEIGQLFERVYVYANQKYHEDTGNQKYQELSGKAMALSSVFSDACSFVEPELMALDEQIIFRYFEEYEPLRLYERMLKEILRQKEHVLTAELEAVLAKASELGNSPQQIFMAFNNADIQFGTVVDEEGNERILTHGTFSNFMESKDRRVRKEAFLKLYQAYEDHKNMLAATFSANLKQAAFFAKMRNYPSVLAAELDGGNIPAAVYGQLIEAVHENLPAMYRYVALRKKILGVEELHMYDVYVPMVEGVEKKISYEEARETVREGLSVLGEDYLKLLDEGFSDGWIDVYENQGKRSGAYSWGAYGTHPYVLLNYSGNLNSVFTLAHEMGHAIHSYYSDHNQPYIYAGYRIFVAEVASTCNEALLIHYLIEHARDQKEKVYLINYFLDQFKGTVYRQTMFAEFEKKAHELMEQEGSVPAQTYCDIYYELNQKYFGPDMVSDPEIALEWARIPHFYTPFYVYQYATGFSAAIAISQKILKGEPGIIEKYKKFLSGGSSEDPIDLLKICGVDMEKRETVDEALAVFASYVEELENIKVL